MRKAITALLIVCLSFGASAILAEPSHSTLYTIVRLPSLGGKQISVSAINDRGQIVGTASDAKGRSHAVLWQGGKLIDIGVLPGYDKSYASGINNVGQVVGWSEKPDPKYESASQAFMWQKGKLQALPTLGSETMAVGINNKGQIVGFAFTSSFVSHAVLWENGRIVDLGSSPTKESIYNADAINDDGLIAGEVITFKQFHSYFDLAIYYKGGMIDLGVIKGRRTRVKAVNNQDEIVGWAEVPVHAEKIEGYVAVVHGGKLKNLRVLPAGSSVWDINDKGQIVGQLGDRAFVESQGKIQDLNSGIPKQTGWVLWTAQGINNRGQIIGRGLYKGQESAFLLSPK